MDLSVVIPSYNGGDSIRDLIIRINETLSDRFSYEILFIFDHGEKGTWHIIKGLQNEFPHFIKAFHLAKNYGQHRALQFGFSKASGDFVVTIDEDMQHDPADIMKLMERQKKNNFDIVYGRFTNLQHTGVRNVTSTVLRKTLKHFIPTLYEDYSPYRLIKRDIAIRTSTMACPYTFIDDFLSRVTQNIAFEDIIHYKRMKGKSSYSFTKLLKHGIYILLAYSKLIPFMLTISVVLIVVAAIIFVLSVVSPENLNTAIFNNRIILSTTSIGLFFILLSITGSYINHRNTIVNNRPINLINEGSV